MDLLPNEDQKYIAEAASTFLEDRLPVSRIRHQRIDGAQEVRAAAEMGWLGATVSEALGGLGLSVADELLIYLEAGKRLISPTVLATTIAAELAADNGLDELVAHIVAGKVAAFAHEITEIGAANGGKSFLLIDGQEAELAVVWTACGLQLRRLASGDTRTPAVCIDTSLAAERLEFADAAMVARADNASPVADRARILSAAMLVGMAQACLAMAAEYAKTREQFGKPIGSFQAIKHKCADMVVSAESALAQTIFAAAAATEKQQRVNFLTAAAKAIASRAAMQNARQNIQIHGGMGYTEECDAHWYLKRAHVMNQLGGSFRQQQMLLMQ